MENLEEMYSDKSLKTAYLTRQIFFQKFRLFLIVTSDSHWKIVKPNVIFFGWKQALWTFWIEDNSTLFLTNIVDFRVLYVQKVKDVLSLGTIFAILPEPC